MLLVTYPRYNCKPDGLVFYMFIWEEGHEHVTVCTWRSDSWRSDSFSLHRMDPGRELRSGGLAACASTCGAISPALSYGICFMVSSESYVVLGLPVRSVINFKLTFVNELRLALTSFFCI